MQHFIFRAFVEWAIIVTSSSLAGANIAFIGENVAEAIVVAAL